MSRSSRKRKRSRDTAPSEEPRVEWSHLPAETINPLSHSPATLRQFSLAGLTETALEPSKWIPGFPHRPARNSGARSDDEDDNAPVSHSGNTGTESSGGEGSQQTRPGDKRRDHMWKKHIRTLRDAVLVFLDRGDVAQAKRTFGLLMRSHPSSRPFSMMHNGYWSIAAEILMRDGEAHTNQASYGRLGLPANIHRVQSFFQDLIQRHPYDYKRPHAVSSLHLYPAQFGYEIYNVHVEQQLTLQKLGEGDEWDEQDEGTDDSVLGHRFAADDDDHESAMYDLQATRSGPHASWLEDKKNRIRMRTLDAMTEIVARMDRVIESWPHSRSHELLRLRGMAALYMADLVIPVASMSLDEDDECQKRRELEHATAQKHFDKILETPGAVDSGIQMFLQLESKEPARHTFSSLTIREHPSTSSSP